VLQTFFFNQKIDFRIINPFKSYEFIRGGIVRYLLSLFLVISVSFNVQGYELSNDRFWDSEIHHSPYPVYEGTIDYNVYLSPSEPTERRTDQLFVMPVEKFDQLLQDNAESQFEIINSTETTPSTYTLHLFLLDEISNELESPDKSEPNLDQFATNSEDSYTTSTLSYPYEIGSGELINGGIGFINGINNCEEEAREHAQRLSRYAKGAKIFGVYNATHTILVDILECILGHCRISTPPVRMLKNHWNHFISSQGPDAKFLQICHSGGTIYVFNALASSPKEIRERIIVLAISPGAVIPKKLCFEAYNYASKRDVIPHLDAIGKIRYGDQLILLDPHPEAEHFDHAFDSPTFQDIILCHLTNYLKEIGYIE